MRAIDQVTALKITREDFYELMYERIEIAHGVIKVLTRRLRRMMTVERAERKQA